MSIAGSEKRCQKQWLQRRRFSTMVCVFYNFVYGIDTTAVNVSLLYYLKDSFDPHKADTMYSIICFVCYTNTLLFGVFIGRIADRTRNLRLLMPVMLFIISIGNLMYTIHFSIWFLIVGRFLSGFCTSLSSAISGELARWYTDPKELKNVIFIYVTAFSFGYVVGPATAGLFTNVNVSIGTWHITKYNCIGVVMASLQFLLMLATIFGVHNLSKEDGATVGQHEISNPNESSSSSLLSITEIIKDPDVMLCIITNTMLYFAVSTCELLIVLVSRNTLGMDIKHLAASIFTASLLYMVFNLTCWQRFVSGSSPLRGLMFCLWYGCYPWVFLLLLTYVEINSIIIKCVIIVLASWTSVVAGISQVIAVREILFRIVPNHSASYMDTVRATSACGGGLATGALLASIVFKHLLYSSIVIMVVLMLLSIPLYMRRDAIYKRMGEDG